MRKFRRNVKALQRMGFIIDVLNFILGLGVVVMCILIMVNMEKNMKFFPVLFLFAFFMNFFLGLKYELKNERKKGVIQGLIAAVLLIISIVGFLGLWR
jgi:hypothetical protein